MQQIHFKISNFIYFISQTNDSRSQGIITIPLPRHLNQAHHQQQPPPASQQQQQQQQPPPPQSPRSVSIFVYKTINSVYKSGRKILVRVCEVASSSKKVKPFKMFNLYTSMNRRGGSADDTDQPKELETTGHDRFCQIRHSRYERPALDHTISQNIPINIICVKFCVQLSFVTCIPISIYR